jgi:small subunit ribosomal protein S8
MAKSSNIVTDPIADMLTRIRNAMGARHEGTIIPFSKIKMEIAKILIAEGYIKSANQTKNEEGHDVIAVEFKSSENGQVLQGLRRISKPGLRVYSEAKDLPRVLNGLGIAIISTRKFWLLFGKTIL